MTANHYKYVLVGGGVASSAAAQTIRQHDRQGSLLLIGQEINRPYRRPPLNKDYLRGQTSRADLFTLPDEWCAENAVELRTGRRVSHLDTNRRGIILDNGEEIAFDKLLLATGGSPRHLLIPGAELPNIYYLRTIADADRLRHAADKALREGRRHDHGRGRGVVIGGGLLGVELAATLVQMGLHVDLLMSTAQAWPRFAGEVAGRLIVRYLEGHGVCVHPQTVPIRLEGDGRVQRVIVTEKQLIDCDFVVPAIGMVPNKDLIRGTPLAAEKAILIDSHCRTNDPAIFAAGDCAAILDPLFGKYRILGHSDGAAAIGALAGANMAAEKSEELQIYSDVSRFTAQVFDLNIQVWGEPRHVERRIIRGNTTVESPGFVEFGIAGDGRIVEAIAVNHESGDQLLSELIRQRVNIAQHDSIIRDPKSDLRSLISSN
jgi:3-phenylpropionate/trans-cinnamate dioxygenase ferredoxin reductase component